MGYRRGGGDMGDSERAGHDTLARVARPTSCGGTSLEHVMGTYSEHAQTKRYTQRRGAWGDAHRAAGTHRANGTSRKRHHGHGAAAAAAAGRRQGAGVSSACDFGQPISMAVAVAHLLGV